MPPAGQLKQQRTVAFTLYYPSRAHQCTALVPGSTSPQHKSTIARVRAELGTCSIIKRQMQNFTAYQCSQLVGEEPLHCPSIAVQLCMSLHTRPLPTAHCQSFRFLIISRTSTSPSYFKHVFNLSDSLFVCKVSNANTIHKVIYNSSFTKQK